MFALLADGGVWGVPRSGVLWRKEDGKLVLDELMPWMPEMEGTITREQLKKQQDREIRACRIHFEAAGVTVVVP